MGADGPDRTPTGRSSGRRPWAVTLPVLGRRSVPFFEPAVWYPTLGVLALEEIVEVPIVAAVVLGRLLVSRQRPYPDADEDATITR